MPADPVVILRDLLRCPSVTPAADVVFSYLDGLLRGAGFTVHRPIFSAPDTPDVENLFAKIGEGSPHLCSLGTSTSSRPAMRPHGSIRLSPARSPMA